MYYRINWMGIISRMLVYALYSMLCLYSILYGIGLNVGFAYWIVFVVFYILFCNMLYCISMLVCG